MDDFRNRTAKSMLTLPLVAVVAGVVWLLPDPRSVWLWGGFAIVCALTYTLRELNNRSQLLRIRSRLVSATFLALFAALPDLHSAGMHLLPAVGLLLALCCLFGSYQQYRPEHYTFHAFFFLSIGSLDFPPLLVLSVFVYVAIFVGRTLWLDRPLLLLRRLSRMGRPFGCLRTTAYAVFAISLARLPALAAASRN